MMGLELRIIMTDYNSYKIQQQSNSYNNQVKIKCLQRTVTEFVGMQKMLI